MRAARRATCIATSPRRWRSARRVRSMRRWSSAVFFVVRPPPPSAHHAHAWYPVYRQRTSRTASTPNVSVVDIDGNCVRLRLYLVSRASIILRPCNGRVNCNVSRARCPRVVRGLMNTVYLLDYLREQDVVLREQPYECALYDCRIFVSKSSERW